MMKPYNKYSLLTFLFLVFAQFSFAQKGGERIAELRKEYILESLQLSEEKEEPFWEAYEQLWSERRKIRREFRRENRSDISATEQKSLKISFQEKELEIQKKELQLFNQYLNDTQIATLEQSEKEFRHMIYERVKKRKKENRNK